MDDLEAVWGPDGRATTDPRSIRTSGPGPSVEGETKADAPSSGASRMPISDVGRFEVPNFHRSSPARRQRPLALAATVCAAAALVIVLVASALAFGTRRPSGVAAGDGADEAAAHRWTTATTIVSAAANLLPGGKDEPGGPPETSAGSSTTVTTEPRASAAPPAARSTDLAGAEHRARQFIEAIGRRDCDGLWSHLRSHTRTFLSASNEPGDPSGRDLLCQGLDTEEVPAMSVRGPARAWGDGGAIVRLESEGEVEDLHLVFEDGAWFIDLLGSMESPDEDSMDRRRSSATSDEVKSDLRNALTAELTLFTDTERFTDDVGELDGVEPALVWRRGVAPPSATPGDVYVALADDARVVCLSARADNGARFLLKRTADGTTTYAGGEIPSVCDGGALGASW